MTQQEFNEFLDRWAAGEFNVEEPHALQNEMYALWCKKFVRLGSFDDAYYASLCLKETDQGMRRYENKGDLDRAAVVAGIERTVFAQCGAYNC